MMGTILGLFRKGAPYVVGEVTLLGALLGRRACLLDTGAAHTVLVIPDDEVSERLASQLRKAPMEMLIGVGRQRSYHIDSARFHFEDVNGEPVTIDIESVNVILYSPRNIDEEYLEELPRGVLGLQSATFGRSRLVVDFGAEEVMLEFNEPPTPFRL